MTRLLSHARTVPLIVACALLAGCVPARLVVNVDPEGERRATVYEITQPRGFRPTQKLNVSFGPYRVVGAELCRPRTERGTGTEQRRHVNWLGFLLLEDQGLFAAERSREDTKEQGLAYDFEIAGSVSWTAKCSLRRLVHHWEARFTSARDGEDHSDSKDALISSDLTCVYSRPGAEDWVLSAQTDATGQEGQAHLTNQHDTFVAERVTSTLVVGDDGRRAHLPFPVPTGYEWTRDGTPLGTLLTYREGRRLLLDRDCPAAIADVLAMGSSGLVLHALITNQD